MVIGENMFAMLLVEKYFKTFTKKEISNTAKNTKVIIALSTESSGSIDQILNKVVEDGGKEHKEPQDLGFMYAVLRTIMDIFVKFSTWTKVPRQKKSD